MVSELSKSGAIGHHEVFALDDVEAGSLERPHSAKMRHAGDFGHLLNGDFYLAQVVVPSQFLGHFQVFSNGVANVP